MSLLPQITVRGRICRNIRKKAFTEPNPILLSVLSNCSQPGPGSIEGRKVSGEKMALKSISRDANEVGERGSGRDGEVTFEKELSYSSSYFQMRNLGTLVTSVTVTTIQIWLKK